MAVFRALRLVQLTSVKANLMTEGLALSVCPGCAGARRSAGHQLCLLITAENIRSPWGGQEGRRERRRWWWRWGGSTAPLATSLSVFIFALQTRNKHQPGPQLVCLLCMCVSVRECACMCVQEKENSKGCRVKGGEVGIYGMENCVHENSTHTHTVRKTS